MANVDHKKELSELHISITLEGKKWAKAQEDAFKKLQENLTVKGFRKGQAPKEVAEKEISKVSIFTEAMKSQLNDMVKEAAAEIKSDETVVLDGPTYQIDKMSENELVITFVYPIYPSITLPNYKKLEIKYDLPEFKTSRVDDELKKIATSRSLLKDKKGKLEKGDVAIFDFEGTIDGKAFDGGKAENFQLEIGSGQFIPGFEDEMVGLGKGDKKDIKLTFPVEYHIPQLKGKAAVFKVHIKEVKNREIPEMNDEFVASFNWPQKTVVDLRKVIEESLREQHVHVYNQQFLNEALSIIKRDLEIPLPNAIIAREMQSQSQIFQNQLKSQNISVSDYKNMTGLTDEMLTNQFRAISIERLKDSVILAEIAKKENFEVTEAEYEEEYKKVAKVYNITENAAKGKVRKEQLQIPLINAKVMNLLIESHKKASK